MLEQIRKILVDQLGVKPERVVPEAKFVEDLGADSLDMVELLMTLEDEFDVSVDDDEASKLKTVQDIIDLIETEKK